jgi:hypothetical protein
MALSLKYRHCRTSTSTDAEVLALSMEVLSLLRACGDLSEVRAISTQAIKLDREFCDAYAEFT